jgi:hypothetical protein
LDPSIRPELDENKIREFIIQLGQKYPGVEVFIFGGEPFVHPKIEFIIKTFNEYNIPFVIQTNFSKYSRDKIKKITDPFKINISVHPTETSIEDIVEGLKTTEVNIKTIDVMYTGQESIKYYFAVKKVINHNNLFLTPITDFGDGYSDTLLLQYLSLKNQTVYKNIIKFENVKRFDRQRSEMWADSNFVTFGKPCLYKDKYFLYSPNLDLYNCCYRIKVNKLCPKTKCFLM